MMSRATEAPRPRSRRASDSAAVLSRGKSMMKKSGPGGLEHGLVAEERGERQERLADVRRGGQVAHDPLERGRVLPRERRPELAHARRLGPGVLAEATEEVGVPEVDLEALEPERAE